MDKISKISIWYSRVVITIITFLFTVLGIKNITNPKETAEAGQIILNSAHAVSEVRVLMGAIPLAFAIIIFSSVFRSNTIYRGIYTAFFLVTVVTVVRLISLSLDGVAPFLVPEIIVTILSGIGLYLETLRAQKTKEA